jgi:hypothetical protein
VVRNFGGSRRFSEKLDGTLQHVCGQTFACRVRILQLGFNRVLVYVVLGLNSKASLAVSETEGEITTSGVPSLRLLTLLI